MGAEAVHRTTLVHVAGRVRRGKLSVPRRIPLPDGKVEVIVACASTRRRPRKGLSYEDLVSHPAFGVLKRRKDTADASAYVAALRRREDERSQRGR